MLGPGARSSILGLGLGVPTSIWGLGVPKPTLGLREGVGAWEGPAMLGKGPGFGVEVSADKLGLGAPGVGAPGVGASDRAGKGPCRPGLGLGPVMNKPSGLAGAGAGEFAPGSTAFRLLKGLGTGDTPSGPAGEGAGPEVICPWLGLGLGTANAGAALGDAPLPPPVVMRSVRLQNKLCPDVTSFHSIVLVLIRLRDEERYSHHRNIDVHGKHGRIGQSLKGCKNNLHAACLICTCYVHIALQTLSMCHQREVSRCGNLSPANFTCLQCVTCQNS